MAETHYETYPKGTTAHESGVGRLATRGTTAKSQRTTSETSRSTYEYPATILNTFQDYLRPSEPVLKSRSLVQCTGRSVIDVYFRDVPDRLFY